MDLADKALAAQAVVLGERLADRKLKLATAESCTGGWIAKAITDIAGSSAWFDCGFVTYSNEAKQRMLGVEAGTLGRYGAVSEPVVSEMAAGALARSSADIAVAVSGIAGPEGGSAEKPVGMVCFGWARRGDEAHSETRYFDGDREAVRRASVAYALQLVTRLLEDDL